MSHSKQNSSDDNQKITLATYEKGVETYLKKTRSEISGGLKEYLDYILTKVPKDAHILEIGSATGRDADYIESKGYNLTRSDAVQGFVEYIRSQGKVALIFNVLSDKLGQQYDVVIATAVLLHLNTEQLAVALENINTHLTINGVLILAVKQGDGEEYSFHKMKTGRYFKYWQQADLVKAVKAGGFLIDECFINENSKWLICIARKKQSE